MLHFSSSIRRCRSVVWWCHMAGRYTIINWNFLSPLYTDNDTLHSSFALPALAALTALAALILCTVWSHFSIWSSWISVKLNMTFSFPGIVDRNFCPVINPTFQLAVMALGRRENQTEKSDIWEVWAVRVLTLSTPNNAHILHKISLRSSRIFYWDSNISGYDTLRTELYLSRVLIDNLDTVVFINKEAILVRFPLSHQVQHLRLQRV